MFSNEMLRWPNPYSEISLYSGNHKNEHGDW